MKHILFLSLMFCGYTYSSQKEDINCRPFTRSNSHLNVNRSYNEQRREHIPESPLIHSTSTSIASQRTDRGAVDLPGVPRITSDDSSDNSIANASPVINVAATIAVKTEAECCNSRCCIDEDTNCRCAIQ